MRSIAMATSNQKIDNICSYLAEKLIFDVVKSVKRRRFDQISPAFHNSNGFLEEGKEIPLDVSEFFDAAVAEPILGISTTRKVVADDEKNWRTLKLCSVILQKLEYDHQIRRKFAHLFEPRVILTTNLNLQSYCKPCSIKLVRLCLKPIVDEPKSPDFKLKDNFLALFQLKSKKNLKSSPKMLNFNRKNSKLFTSKSKKWRSIRRYLLKKEKFRRILKAKMEKMPDSDVKIYCFRCGKSDSTVRSPIFFKNEISNKKLQDQNLLLCSRCCEPYDQWYMEPWRFANYVCKFNFGLDCGCEICHFWSCVDFVRMHLALNFPDQDDYLNYVENECALRFSDLQNFEHETVNHAHSSSSNQQQQQQAQNNLFDILSTPPTCSSSIGGKIDNLDQSFFDDEYDRSIIFPENPPRGVRYVSRKSCQVLKNRNLHIFHGKNGQILRLSALPDWKKRKISRKYLAKLDEDENLALCQLMTAESESEFLPLKSDNWRVANKERDEETTPSSANNDNEAGKEPSCKPKRSRTFRCRRCEGCLKPNCGDCVACKDMKIFNGPGISKQGCRQRVCIRLLEKRRQSKEMRKKNKAQKRRISV